MGTNFLFSLIEANLTLVVVLCFTWFLWNVIFAGGTREIVQPNQRRPNRIFANNDENNMPGYILEAVIYVNAIGGLLLLFRDPFYQNVIYIVLLGLQERYDRRRG